MMSLDMLISFIFAGLFIISGFIAIGLIFYIGRTRIKQIDRLVYGCEFSNDSIFSLMLRVPNYASAFIWKWSAKKNSLDEIVCQFDAKFKWPFVASFILSLVSLFFLIIGILFDKYFWAG